MKYAVVSDIGVKRKFNQDSFYAQDNLFVVADGMGGHNGGDMASKIAVDAFSKCEKTSTPEEMLKNAIDLANKEIRNKAFSEPELEGMGTTIVACQITEDMVAHIANVGDSRAYHIDGEKMERITVDHSVVQELIESGMITAEEAETHPQRNVITRAVGSDNSVIADFFEKQLKSGEFILLCSDGLTAMVGEEEIHSIIKNGTDLEGTTQKLVDAANEAGGKDNITVLLIQL